MALLILSIGILLPSLSGFAHAETSPPEEAADGPTNQIRDGVFGERLDDAEDPGYLERQLAGLIINFAEFIRKVLGLKDLNELIFLKGSENLIFNTFDSSIFSIIVDFFNSFLTVSAWLAVLSIIAWAFMIMFKGGTQQGQLSINSMSEGFVIYFVGLNLGGYMYKLVFSANYVVVLWAIDGLKMATGWDVTQVNILDIMTSETKSLGQAALIILIVFCVGMLNYQYALRLATLIFLMVIFPWVLYRCTTPGSQKVLDEWFREFAAQVFTQAGHAIGYAIFIAILAKQPSFWILLVFLVGMPTITSLVRIPIGAKGGGTVGGGFGMGTAMAVQGIVKGLRGKGSGGKNAPPSNNNGIMPSDSFGATPATADAMSPVSSPSFNTMAGGASNLAPAAPGKGTGAKFGAGSRIGSDMNSSRGTGSSSQPASRGTGNSSQPASPLRSFVESRGGVVGLAKTGGAMAGKAAGAVARKTAIAAGAGAGFIAGSALSGSMSGGFVGAALGSQGVAKLEQGAGAVAKGIKGLSQAYQSYRAENPIQETQMAQAPLALPMGSSPPLALPAGPGVQPGGTNRPLELAGPVHTPLQDQGGVMVTSKGGAGSPVQGSPSFPGRPNMSGQSLGHPSIPGGGGKRNPGSIPNSPNPMNSTMIPPVPRSPMVNQRNRSNMNHLQRVFDEGSNVRSGPNHSLSNRGSDPGPQPPPVVPSSPMDSYGDPGPPPPLSENETRGFSQYDGNSRPRPIDIQPIKRND
ncbi:hypothetical protein [Paenibacillus amylolyticus]|uniref:hypothetical protein n=1 Tax=Paenibacillus amylolyticus TaxID=1451 RepID=UPI003398CE8D